MKQVTNATAPFVVLKVPHGQTDGQTEGQTDRQTHTERQTATTYIPPSTALRMFMGDPFFEWASIEHSVQELNKILLRNGQGLVRQSAKNGEEQK